MLARPRACVIALHYWLLLGQQSRTLFVDARARPRENVSPFWLSFVAAVPRQGFCSDVLLFFAAELHTLIGLPSSTLWAASPYCRLFESSSANPQLFVDAKDRFQRFFKPRKFASSSDYYYELVEGFTAPSPQLSDIIEEYILAAIEAFQERQTSVWPPRGTATADSTPRPFSTPIWGRMCTSFEAWTSMSSFYYHFHSFIICFSAALLLTILHRHRSRWPPAPIGRVHYHGASHGHPVSVVTGARNIRTARGRVRVLHFRSKRSRLCRRRCNSHAVAVRRQ